MRWIIAIAAGCAILACLNAALAQGENFSDLKNLISSREDPSMNCEELSHLLNFHNYNSIPRQGYVELNLGGAFFMLTPNGDHPGLCEIEISIQQCPNTRMYEVDRII
jgi:hypothetical protein